MSRMVQRVSLRHTQLLEKPSANRRVSLTFPDCSRIDRPWPCSRFSWGG